MDETKKQVKLDQSFVEGCFFLLQRSKVAVFFVALDRKKNRKERIFLPFLDSKGLSFASEDQTFCERLLRFFSFSENHRKVAADEFPNLS